nr:hypothetical protein [Tanacetum cinerariifolium]
MAIDSIRWDWSYMANEEENHALVADDDVPTEFALMAKSSLGSEKEVYDDSYCSKSCRKNTENLNTKISKLNEQLSNCKTDLYHYKRGLSHVEVRLVEFKEQKIKFCEKIRGLERDVEVKNNKIEYLENELKQVKKEKEGLDNKLTGFEKSSKDLDNLLGSQRSDKNKEGLEYSAVPSPTQVYSPPKKDLSWTGLHKFVDDTITNYSRPTPSIDESKCNTSNNFYVSEHEGSSGSIMSKPMIKFVKAADCSRVTKTNNTENARKSTVKYAEMYRNTTKSPKLRESDCGVWVENEKIWPKNNFAHKNVTPRAVLLKTSKTPISRPNMNVAQPKMTSFAKTAHSNVKRPFQGRSTVRTQPRVSKVSTVTKKFPTFDSKFTIVKLTFTTDLGNKGKAVKASACWIWRPKQNTTKQGGGKITGKGIIKTGKVEFENVYFVKELKYNLFSVSQICDNKNSILFTDSECIVLGKDFKLKDDTNVLLRTPKQHNMYYIDLNNIVPYKNLTCLVAKASIDESMLWHRRLGHLNFKTMNKLVRNNLVRGLPSKCFENDHTYVACLKGKQHKASCKTKLVNSVSKPLHTLHMDLFEPTSVSSLNHKWYCLVVTDDFSRFTWTFFLRTKDETSSILRNFITEIENLKDLKVRIIRCDKVGEFKNKEMNEFCTTKGIRREFSNARTPQQNGVAKRRNRTLMEAAETMFAAAKLPVTFWAEAVNTACYVQNRILVNKYQNKTPYELFNSRTPGTSFLRPFRCHVMILNTLDHLGKFDAKGDEGYFVGYSMSSKAFREHLLLTFQEHLLLTFQFHKAHMETKKSNGSNADDPESSGISNPTATSKIPSAEQVEPVVSLTVETEIPTIRDFSQQETPSLGNALTLSNRFEDIFGEEANLSNMETSIPVSPTPTVKIHKDHPKSQIIGPFDTPVQTRHKSKEMEEQMTNKFDDILRVSTSSDEIIGVEADVSNVETSISASPTPTLVVRNKARLVAQGHTQEEGIDYDEVFAPVARIEAIRLFLPYVKSAFLYGTIDEEVYVMQPPGFQDLEFPDRVYEVEKAMYGLHQAPRAWYGTLSKYLLDNSFQRGTIYQTLFIKKHEGEFLLVQVYVDDIIFGLSNPQLCREFKALMHEKFQMSDMGELTLFLGLQVLQKKDGIFLSQDKYVGDILKKFGYSDVRSANTPMDKENPWGKDGPGKDVELHLYRSIIGFLMYLTASRLDITFAVCACARHQVTPKECHLYAVKRIFRYLKGHPKLGLWVVTKGTFSHGLHWDSVSKPLYTLHMDLFGPTSVSSLNHKWYCLVVTDDFSRCDNGGEFKNKEMNELCTKKGIRREFSNARTPQQNRVAEKKNRTLIEAARTNLADAKLSVIFWAEAVNTACYVQNRILVNKSQNKTPYKLFNSRIPAIGFLRQFGCHVMILNTLDHLGKFDSKGDKGYFVGYSMSSKAFRVFNKRAKKVEENQHVDFLENKLIEKGAGPNWLFDIDTLTNSMNYVPVVVAGTSSTNNSVHIETKNSDGCNADDPESSGISNPTATSKIPSVEQMEPAVSLTVETEILTVSLPIPTVCLDTSPGSSSDPRIISKGDFSQQETPSLGNALTLSKRFDDIFREEADLSNMETSIPEEPKKIFDALKDPSWVEAMQEELLQLKIQNVWILVDCPKGVRPISTKWVLKNKKDERGIVIRNKARLVAQGYTQEEGIDYEEVFAPVARIEAIRLFLAYASFMGFTVYQMDVKSTFLYNTIDEDVYVMQPLRFYNPEFPDTVYKVEKAMYRLHQALGAWYGTLSKYLLDNGFHRLWREFEALMHEKFQLSAMGELTFFLDLQVLQKKDGIFLSQDKYVGDILKKFGYSDVRSMIGSLMYPTASRPDIMFAVCACARHQVTPKECHLHAVKRIFRYLKGHHKLGLWYPKDSPFDLVAYSDSDYGGATQNRKSTTGGKTEHNIDFHQIVDFLEASHISPKSTGFNEFSSNIVTAVGEGSAIPTKPHHTPSPQEQHSPHHDPSSPSHPTTTTEPIPQTPTETPTETPTLRQYSRKSIRIAQSKALSPAADEPASLLRDDSQGEAFPTISSLDTGQDRENINKTSTLPHESSPRVTSLDADEGSMPQKIQELMELCTDMQRQQTQMAAKIKAQDLEISGGSMEIGEEVGVERSTELESNDTEEMVNVLSSMEAVNILTSEVAVFSLLLVFQLLISAKDKGKEKVVKSEVPKKRKLQEQIDAQVAKEIEEEFARENQKESEQLAKDSEISRLHAEEDLKMMIEGLDRSNEVIAKHLQEYEQAEAELTIRERIELINELVKYQDHHAKILKYQAQQSKPFLKKEQREFYMSVLRSHAGWKTTHFRGMTLEEIKEKFIPVWKQLEDFVPMSSKEEERVLEDYKTKGSYSCLLVFFMDMLKQFDREDLHQLWILVKETLSIKQATKDKEKELWVELKRLFEPDFEDQLWTHNQVFMHDPLEWKLYDTCGVHHVFTKDQEIFMLVEMDYPLKKGLATVMI